jgi:hypothetical protein
MTTLPDGGKPWTDKYDVFVRHTLPDGKTEEALATGIPVNADSAPREAWNYAAKGFSGTVRRCGDRELLFTFPPAGRAGYEEWQRGLTRERS